MASSSSANDLLASVTGALEMKNLRPLVLFLYVVVFLSFFLSDSCSMSYFPFSKWKRGSVFLQEGKSLCSKKKHERFRPLRSSQWGDSIKSLPCDLFSEKQTASRVSKDQSHQRRAACVRAKSRHLSESFHHGKNCWLSQWRVTSMAAHWYIDAVNASDSAVKVLRLKLSCYLWHVSLGR